VRLSLNQKLGPRPSHGQPEPEAKKADKPKDKKKNEDKEDDEKHED